MKVKKTGIIQVRIDQDKKDRIEIILAEKYKKSISEFVREKLEEVIKNEL